MWFVMVVKFVNLWFLFSKCCICFVIGIKLYVLLRIMEKKKWGFFDLLLFWIRFLVFFNFLNYFI